ncbi:hypothetical protein ACFQJD_02600 [Haloplanus sp. GCM10025708]|uniref:hypothetical protein n=1 Tax=Haloplanus sp. GCM10025708 TaxID=3252679 RepID=UPI00360F6004
MTDSTSTDVAASPDELPLSDDDREAFEAVLTGRAPGPLAVVGAPFAGGATPRPRGRAPRRDPDPTRSRRRRRLDRRRDRGDAGRRRRLPPPLQTGYRRIRLAGGAASSVPTRLS